MLINAFYKRLLDPCVILIVLYLTILIHHEHLTGSYLLLGIITFFICTNVFEQVDQLRDMREAKLWFVVRHTLTDWLIIVGLLALIGDATEMTSKYPRQILIEWLIAAPIALLITQIIVWRFNKEHKGGIRTAVIVGVNAVAMKLYKRTLEFPNIQIDVRGFFDDRSVGRQALSEKIDPIGGMADVADYIRRNNINVIYISQPISAQPRILKLLEELKDTTTSIYFLPDIYIFDVIQSRFDTVAGIPVVAICESPFTGINSMVKRASDVVLGLAIQIMLLPIMLVIAIAVKMSSPGPVIFKQRRYGLDGEEIIVYKFRSMTVSEETGSVEQAKKNDRRVTKLGAFLRRTSLDELPQFINVLQGRMSIVGPRPHAVEHNELYRKQITGYMLRHKVRPGITGWAQVHGLRGETDTLDKMKARIQYDLDYLKRWSLTLDLLIIVRTIRVVLKRENAY